MFSVPLVLSLIAAIVVLVWCEKQERLKGGWYALAFFLVFCFVVTDLSIILITVVDAVVNR